MVPSQVSSPRPVNQKSVALPLMPLHHLKGHYKWNYMFAIFYLYCYLYIQVRYLIFVHVWVHICMCKENNAVLMEIRKYKCVSRNTYIRRQNHVKKLQCCRAVVNAYLFIARLKAFCDKSGDHSAGSRLFQVVSPLTAKPFLSNRSPGMRNQRSFSRCRWCQPEVAVAGMQSLTEVGWSSTTHTSRPTVTCGDHSLSYRKPV